VDIAIREGAAKGAEAVRRKVMESWHKFVAGKRCEDDATLLVLGRGAGGAF